tara:strand:- start:5938 stop:6282 length:345 start_codon:yes stop_codon:yes gene_type:complete
MSSRRPRDLQTNETAARLRAELESLKTVAQQAEVAGSAAEVASHNVEEEHSHAFDKLSSVEQAAASLKVHPQHWKPIGWLNNKHYEQLIKSNTLEDSLARRIEVRAKHRSSFDF